MNTIPPDQISRLKKRLSPVGVFEGLQPEQVRDLEGQGIYLQYHQELVVADSQAVGHFFFIVEGGFEVSRINPDHGRPVVLANINDGQCFGEMSFLTGAPASANVMAAGHVTCWAIPHEALRGFISSHPGGAALAVNVAALLARRVQEGNTRLLGMNSTLSAYFGHAARVSDARTMEAPRTGEAAEMEIPDEIFDVFAREVLNKPQAEPLTQRERATVRSKVESNEVDIVPWLEQGQRGKHLRVRLKFVEDTQAARLAVSPARSSVVEPPGPMVVHVPQVRARMAPVVSYVEKPSSKIMRWINIVSYMLLPVVTAYIIFAFIPLESREALVRSKGFQSLPFQGLWNSLLFRSGSQSNPATLGKDASSSMAMGVSKPTGVSAKLRLSKPVPSAQRLHVKLGPKGGKPVVDEALTIQPGMASIDLLSLVLQPGDHMLECICEEWPADLNIPATLIVTTRR